jgi:uncharacterized membrane protein
MNTNYLITNDAVVIGILFFILFLIFEASKSENEYLQKLFKFLPPILFCYFIPGLLNSYHVISGENSGVYPFVSKYLLPVCLLLFTLSLDINMLKKLGWKALLVFFAGTIGVMLGGPIAVKIMMVLKPDIFSAYKPDELWRGLGTIAASWIGGGANQTALKEILKPTDYIFSQMVAIDVIIAETWLAVLLIGVGYSKKINKWLNADDSVVEEIKESLKIDKAAKEKIPEMYDYLKILTVGFVCTGLSYFLADLIVPFIKNNYPVLEKFSLASTTFWTVFFVTIFGMILSLTQVRNLEHVGASKIGTLILYIMVASIGMKMDLFAIVDNLGLFYIALIWIVIHAIFIIIASKLLKSPYFLLAVGSQANIGGAASASVVAAAFHPTLVSIGVIFAVLGYVIGTYGGYLTALIIQWVLA